MIKRLIDILASACGLLLASPLLLTVMYLVWRQDRHSPFYIAPRVGRNGVPFRMVKMRSMIVNSAHQGASTSSSDMRITPIGHFIRRFKIDELTQLWNVLIGDMSLVGPRPQVQSGVDVYTPREMELLRVRPGITDFSSIVFSDEGDILNGQPDADVAYDELIRPGKSRLGLFYIQHQSVPLDLALILLTLSASISRTWALARLSSILESLGADKSLVDLAQRKNPLFPMSPP